MDADTLILMAPLFLAGFAATLWSFMRRKWNRRFSAFVLVTSIASPLIYVFGICVGVSAHGEDLIEAIAGLIMTGAALLALAGAAASLIFTSIALIRFKQRLDL